MGSIRTRKKTLRISPSTLDALMQILEVRFVSLAECVLSAGYRLELVGVDAPSIHYCLDGAGRFIVGDDAPLRLGPHTLIIVPAGHRFRIEVPPRQARSAVKTVVRDLQAESPNAIQRYVVGEKQPELIVICGYFRASYGGKTDLFAGLRGPIVEQFGSREQIDSKLRHAMSELMSQEVGSGAMSAALLKQIFIELLRRSLASQSLWVERFAMLSDPQIARAFAQMAAHPGAAHSLQSLARAAGLGRSTFVARFVGLVGKAPMVVLRQLRLHQAATQLRSTDLTVADVARQAGYASRSSFVRAFRETFGSAPTRYASGGKRARRVFHSTE